MSSSSDHEELVHDFPQFLKVYKDGRVQRYFPTNFVPPEQDPIAGVRSKDVVISPENNLKARIFAPLSAQDPPRKLPLLIHFHPGGFCTGSAFDLHTKNALTSVVSRANVVAVSIEYRLAPEDPLPAAYYDSWAGLEWAAAHADGHGPEEWINQQADLRRVFLAGESAGGNIAHYVSVRAGSWSAAGELKIVGVIITHPYFAREEDEMIKYLYPNNTGFGYDPILNPKVDPGLKKMGCERVMVMVAEEDELKERGVGYWETLKESGWGGEVEFYETKGEGHCFHLHNPSCENASHLFLKMVEFINKD